jgi:hypothetical protein
MLVIGLAVSAIEYLSQQPEVLDIERTLTYEPMMKFLKPFLINGLSSSALVDEFYANGSTLLTDFWGLLGAGQVVAVADTGVMIQNCYL